MAKNAFKEENEIKDRFLEKSSIFGLRHAPEFKFHFSTKCTFLDEFFRNPPVSRTPPTGRYKKVENDLVGRIRVKGVLEQVFLRKIGRKNVLSKLAHFLLNLAERGFLDFLTPRRGPRVLEIVFSKKNKRKNVETRPFYVKSRQKWFSWYSYPRGPCVMLENSEIDNWMSYPEIGVRIIICLPSHVKFLFQSLFHHFLS